MFLRVELLHARVRNNLQEAGIHYKEARILPLGSAGKLWNGNQTVLLSLEHPPVQASQLTLPHSGIRLLKTQHRQRRSFKTKELTESSHH